MSAHGSPLRGEDIRQKNEKLILRAIYNSNGISQSEVVKMTGLKAPTVLRIFTYLEQQGLIEIDGNYTEPANDKKGRRPVYYRVVAHSRYVIGVEFWSLTAHVLVVDFERKPVFTEEILLESDMHADEVLEKICKLIETALKKAKIAPEQVLGIGIGAPGSIQVDTGEIIRYMRIKGATSFPLGARVRERFNLPVRVANNAGVIAMNAYKRGVASSSEALFTYLIRHGVGGAFINRGKLVSVLGKTAFEIGHMIVKEDGKPCYCGSQGCLEAYISEGALLEDLSELGYEIRSIEDLDKRLAQGDAELSREIQALAKYLSVNAKNIQQMLELDGFLVITRSKYLSDLYAELIRKALQEKGEGEAVEVYSEVYNALEAGFGACDLAFDEFFFSDSTLY